MSTQDTTLPALPDSVAVAISAYGDERADDSPTALNHYRAALAAVREWGAAIAAQAQQDAAVKESLTLEQAQQAQYCDEQVPANVRQAYAMAQVLLDVHAELGCKWGDNIYKAISDLKQAQQAQGVPADAALSIVRRFERMVGDYNCLFTEYQGKTMPADVYQRFTALREERIPTARKELAALLAAAPQAEPQPSTPCARCDTPGACREHEPGKFCQTNAQAPAASAEPQPEREPLSDELVERVMRSAQTLALAIHFEQPKSAQDAAREKLRAEVFAAMAAPKKDPGELEGLTDEQILACRRWTGAGTQARFDKIAFARAIEHALAERWGVKLAGIGTKGGDKP